MALLRKDRWPTTCAHLEAHPSEVEALYRDILINVTSFFRDPEVFEALKTRRFPQISRARPAETPIRIWVPGCSTGQEAYSLAIALLEFLDDRLAAPADPDLRHRHHRRPPSRRRRAGLVPREHRGATCRPNACSGSSPRRSGGYRISKSIRDLCVFAKQNVAADPPFSRLDLSVAATC